MKNSFKRTWIRVALNKKDLVLTIESSFQDGTKPDPHEDYLEYSGELMTLTEISEVVMEYIKDYRLQAEHENRSLEDVLLCIADGVLNEGGEK